MNDDVYVIDESECGNEKLKNDDPVVIEPIPVVVIEGTTTGTTQPIYVPPLKVTPIPDIKKSVKDGISNLHWRRAAKDVFQDI